MFKQKILDNYVKNLDETKVAAAWQKFCHYKEKADAIKNFKEEEYQDGFLHDIFEECLGYTLKTANPTDFNLTREHKNETDGKKADGAILINSEVVALIELKDQSTKDLEFAKKGELNPIDQCFRYLNSHQKAKYAIVSNFNELRFYMDKKTECERFNLFYLDFEGFKKLYLILSFESIKNGLPQKLKDETEAFEKEISKQLYRDYSFFRSQLFDNICKNNPQINKTTLLCMTQKLLDRMVFIFFAEDTGLIPEKSIAKIIEVYKNDWTPKPLWHYYKLYFEAIDRGNERTGISIGYNGELFKPDIMLEELVIDDEPLDFAAQKLSDYNFKSDININILGHIFENSLSELEELKAQIDGEKFDVKKSKRKKRRGVLHSRVHHTLHSGTHVGRAS